MAKVWLFSGIISSWCCNPVWLLATVSFHSLPRYNHKTLLSAIATLQPVQSCQDTRSLKEASKSAGLPGEGGTLDVSFHTSSAGVGYNTPTSQHEEQTRSFGFTKAAKAHGAHKVHGAHRKSSTRRHRVAEQQMWRGL